MPHDYQAAYRRGIDILTRAKWQCDPESMFRPPSLAKGKPARVECERMSAAHGLAVVSLLEEVASAARIHHFIAICGTKARDYFLNGMCPLGPEKIAQLSRRMPPFIRAKMDALLAGSVNVVSNPTHAFDTDGYAELKRRLPKFRATMEHYAVSCSFKPEHERTHTFKTLGPPCSDICVPVSRIFSPPQRAQTWTMVVERILQHPP